MVLVGRVVLKTAAKKILYKENYVAYDYFKRFLAW